MSVKKYLIFHDLCFLIFKIYLLNKKIVNIKIRIKFQNINLAINDIAKITKKVFRNPNGFYLTF